MIEKKFEDWFKNTFKDLHKMVEDGDSIARNHKKALWLGYESRQAEVDELQKRIDELVNINESVVSYKNQLLEDFEVVMNENKND